MTANLILDYGLAIGSSLIVIGAGLWVLVMVYRKTFGSDDNGE